MRIVGLISLACWQLHDYSHRLPLLCCLHHFNPFWHWQKFTASFKVLNATTISHHGVPELQYILILMRKTKSAKVFGLHLAVKMIILL